jgi:hypothetical protein
MRGDKKTVFLEGEKSFLFLLFKVYNKVSNKKILVSVYPMDRTLITNWEFLFWRKI